MALRKMDLEKNCLFVLSGLANPLGKVLALEMCRRFKAGSLALLIDSHGELLCEVKKEIEHRNKEIEVICCELDSWQQVTRPFCNELMRKTLESFAEDKFELAFIVHNEGSLATTDLMEPQELPQWLDYIQQHVSAPLALNQEFLQHSFLKETQKLVVNITSSLQIQPLSHCSLEGSCLRARNMYFHGLSFMEERDSNLSILCYGAGIFDTHKPQSDLNNNTIDLLDLGVDAKIIEAPRVQPLESVLRLVNILEETSFISGHDVDYYDTFVL